MLPRPDSAGPSGRCPLPSSPSVLWLANGTSAIAKQVQAQLPGQVQVAELGTSQLDAPQAPVRVIDLGPHERAIGPDWLRRQGATGTGPMTLVLLPTPQWHEAGAWLDAGADRCLPAGSDLAHLLAMLRSMLRRSQGQMAALSEHGPLRFDHDTQTLFHAAERVPLTCRETQVAALLFQSGRAWVRPLDILRALGMGEDRRGNTALVSLYVHRINRKIGRHGLHIGFVRGYGYRLVFEPEARQPVASSWLSPLASRPARGWGGRGAAQASP